MAARTSDSFLSQRLRYSSIRWINLFVIALLGAVALELILPLAWQQARYIRLPYSPVFIWVTVWLAVVLLTYFVSEPIQIRKRQWRTMLWYPPTWFAVPLASGLAAASETLPVPFRPQSSGADWQNLSTIAPIALAVALGLAARQLPWRKPTRVTTRTIPTAAFSFTWSEIDAWLSAGERPLASGDRDLFHHHKIVGRIAQNVVHDRGHLALLGQFGSGKTSILNLVVAHLARRPETFIVARFDVWAVRNPGDVPRVALNRIVNALDEYVNAIPFRSLPLLYQQLVSNDSTRWLSTALEVENVRDSIELLGGLSRVLTTIDARLVLIVEDVERAGGDFDTRHLQRLLWALRDTSRIQFILSVDPHHTALDFPKLCDSIELVPAVEVDYVAAILRVAYDHWTTKFSDIEPAPEGRPADKLRIRQAAPGEIVYHMQRIGRDTPLDALVALLDTPRSLKHVLARVDRVWNNLHGEVELDDLVILSALRHGAEPVYRFLLADIDAARHAPDAMYARTKDIENDWNMMLGNMSARKAIQELVDLLGIKQLTKHAIRAGVDPPQGLQASSPVDYFRRIIAEEIRPSELRDQEVLQDIDEWKRAARGPLLDRLLHSSDDDARYPRVWEQFSERHTASELMHLVERLVAMIKEREGSAASSEHASLITLWRQCHRRLTRNAHKDWLCTLIGGTIPVSLHFANDLLDLYTGEFGIVDAAGRADIQRSVIATVRDTVHTGHGLGKLLTPEDPSSIRTLIAGTATDANLAAHEAWADHLPAVLIDAAKTHPELLMPELANLAATDESLKATGPEYPPRFTNPYEIDRDRMRALFADHLDEALELLANYTGDNVCVVRAIDGAREWIDERRIGDQSPHVP